MKKVYISGPMIGIKDNNYPAFFEAEKKLIELGFDVINPARNAPPDPATWEAFMRMAIKQVCESDVVTVLEKWELSKGANIEVNIASIIKIPVYTLEYLQADHENIIAGEVTK